MKKYAVGVDIGGTSVKLGLLETDGTLVETGSIPTRTENNGEYIIGDIAEAVNKLISKNNIDKSDVVGIGMGVPGPVLEDGTVNRCVNLGWGVFNVSKQLSELTGLPVKAQNDANCAALGEQWKGAAEGTDSMILITLGTGVGSGIVINGKIISGASGAAGELGHITINKKEKEQCTCGRYGCFEQYASGRGMIKVANEFLLETGMDSVLRTQLPLDAKKICDAAKDGDESACAIMDRYGDYLAFGIGTAASIINPQTVVIGGGVVKAGQLLIDAVMNHFYDYVFHASSGTEIKIAELGNDAGIYGAARLVCI